MLSSLTKMKNGEFFNKLLNGVAIGIVVGLIPNAILGEILKFLPQTDIVKHILFVIQTVQSSVPILIGCLVGVQFGFTPIEISTLGATTFIASGVAKIAKVNDKAIVQLAGIGDLINVILVSFLAVVFIFFIRDKVGSLALILIPVLTVTIIGGVGLWLLPYVSQVSKTIGNIINEFTKLQPLLMSILLSVSFSIIIISPISTVAIAIAIGLTGLSSGAANLGIASCAMTLVLGSIHAKNKLGITLAVFFGSMKMFIPNWMRHPIINLPIILNGVIAGITAYIFNIQGTPQSAGFGFSGMVGPINAFGLLEGNPFIKFIIIFVAYFVVTGVGAYLVDVLFVKVLKLYKHDIYEFK